MAGADSEPRLERLKRIYVAMVQRENCWGPEVAGSIFPFTNSFFWVF